MADADSARMADEVDERAHAAEPLEIPPAAPASAPRRYKVIGLSGLTALFMGFGFLFYEVGKLSTEALRLASELERAQHELVSARNQLHASGEAVSVGQFPPQVLDGASQPPQARQELIPTRDRPNASEEAASAGAAAPQLPDRTAELRALQDARARARQELISARNQLKASREAVFFVTRGIELYHQEMYREAVQAYDEALKLDPRNPHVADLKGYSLFKAKRLKESVAALRYALEIDPNYAWGHFDLARVSCARKEFSNARESAARAVKLAPGLEQIMFADEEFTDLCGPILGSLKTRAGR